MMVVTCYPSLARFLTAFSLLRTDPQSILPNELGEERLHEEPKERLRGRRDRLLCMGELEYPGFASARSANFQFSGFFFCQFPGLCVNS